MNSVIKEKFITNRTYSKTAIYEIKNFLWKLLHAYELI